MICIPMEAKSGADATEAAAIRGGVHSMAEVLRELLPHYGIDPPKERIPVDVVSVRRCQYRESGEMVTA